MRCKFRLNIKGMLPRPSDCFIVRHDAAPSTNTLTENGLLRDFYLCV